MNAAAGTHTDEGISTDLDQFLHGDGCGGTANAGGADRHLLTQKGTAPDVVFTVHADMNRVIKVLGNCLAATRITRKQNITADVAFYALNVILLFSNLHSILLTCFLCAQ